MARLTLSAKVGTSLGEGRYATSSSRRSDVDSTQAKTDQAAAVSNAISVGVTSTAAGSVTLTQSQATTLAGLMATVTTDLATPPLGTSDDVVVSINLANCTTLGALQATVAEILRQAAAGKELTKGY